MNGSRRVVTIAILAAMALQACTLPGAATPTPMLGEPPLGPLSLYLSTGGDDANDCLSEATACRTLYNAFRLSTPGSTIHIGPGEFSREGSGLSIYHDLTFLGAGIDRTVLSADSDVLTLSRGRYVFRDLTVSGTSAGPLRNGLDIRDGAVVTLENVRVRGKATAVSLFPGTELISPVGLRIEATTFGISNRGTLRLTGATFSQNGAALSNGGTAELTDVAFDGNGEVGAGTGAASATVSNGVGGALVMRGGRISNSRGYGLINMGGASALIDGVLVNDNAGTAVWHQEGTLEVQASVIRDNGVYGIAVGGRSSVADVGTVNVHETAVVRNRSAGVRIDRGRVTLQNTTISENIASSSGGGGIWMYGGDLFLLNSTVVLNTGHGIESGPAGDVPAVVTVRRSVIALNSAEECTTTGTSTADTGSRTYGPSPYHCTEASQASLGLGALTSEAGTLVHPLQPGSPLIDAGGPPALCSSVDQRGFARPVGITCDAGAYEAGSTTTTAAIVIATPDGSATPAIILLPTFTATPAPPVFTFLQNANCRKGPGTLYDVVTSLTQGAAANALARNDLSSWFRVTVPDTEVTCWVAASTGEASGLIDVLPVEVGQPLPGTPGGLTIGQAVCSPNLNYYSVPLSWGDAGNETGYRLYRNGSLVATLGANATDYDDQAPKGENLAYTLEAFNKAGVSERVQATLGACQ